eukprot:gb/GECG01011770.1/.p1 GENE.gb/GECG01011770.1/~~gb/GECG01011770.1/.p1  ORF type:complete len:154 (+),score=19.00 gb/GECG01011770.1/:1-462(+)
MPDGQRVIAEGAGSEDNPRPPGPAYQSQQGNGRANDEEVVLSDEQTTVKIAPPKNTDKDGEEEGSGAHPDDLAYQEPESSLRRMIAFATNPFYNQLKGNLIFARLLMTLRTILVLAAIMGAILQVSEAMKGECFVYSEVGSFTNFPQDVPASL